MGINLKQDYHPTFSALTYYSKSYHVPTIEVDHDICEAQYIIPQSLSLVLFPRIKSTIFPVSLPTTMTPC